MPRTAEETLNLLVAATQEAKDATRKLHEEVKNYKHFVAMEHEEIKRQIDQAIFAYTDQIKVSARRDMNEAVEVEIAKFANILREKLHLDG